MADVDIDWVTDERVGMAYMRFEVVFGSGVRPPPDSEPTVDQLSCVHHILRAGGSHYLDLPYGDLPGIASCDGSVSMVFSSPAMARFARSN
jgi:hypothetical protein